MNLHTYLKYLNLTVLFSPRLIKKFPTKNATAIIILLFSTSNIITSYQAKKLRNFSFSLISFFMIILFIYFFCLCSVERRLSLKATSTFANKQFFFSYSSCFYGLLCSLLWAVFGIIYEEISCKVHPSNQQIYCEFIAFIWSAIV